MYGLLVLTLFRSQCVGTLKLIIISRILQHLRHFYNPYEQQWGWYANGLRWVFITTDGSPESLWRSSICLWLDGNDGCQCISRWNANGIVRIFQTVCTLYSRLLFTLPSKMILTNSFRIVVSFWKLVPIKERMAASSSKWNRHHSSNNHHQELIQGLIQELIQGLIQELTREPIQAQVEVEDMPAKGTAADLLLLIRATGVNKDECRQSSISLKIMRFNVRMSRGNVKKMFKIGQRPVFKLKQILNDKE